MRDFFLIEKKNPAKIERDLPAVISLILIVGFNHRVPIVNLSKRMVNIYTTGKTIHQFSISYMINPSLKFNNVFRTQVGKCLGYCFYIMIMKKIEYVL